MAIRSVQTMSWLLHQRYSFLPKLFFHFWSNLSPCGLYHSNGCDHGHTDTEAIDTRSTEFESRTATRASVTHFKTRPSIPAPAPIISKQARSIQQQQQQQQQHSAAAAAAAAEAEAAEEEADSNKHDGERRGGRDRCGCRSNADAGVQRQVVVR
jgi:hypothetical protein